MAISGLIISTRTAEQATALAAILAADPRFSCGPQCACRLAAVLATDDDAADEDICRHLWTHDGVVLVDVVSVHLSDGSAHPVSATTDQ